MESIRAKARRISKTDNSCLKCVWHDDPWCDAPYTDFAWDDGGFCEPCYFGVYRYLSGGELSPEEQIKRKDFQHESN